MRSDHPFFYVDTGFAEGAVIEPPEETARHIVQVLRMREGEKLVITDGKGHSAVCSIESVSKRSCTVRVGPITVTPDRRNNVTVAISLLKNANRFEWFLEKAAELGITRIVPLLCSRTEKQHFRKDRASSILVSAMQQSQQSWLTELSDPMDVKKFIAVAFEGARYIAHCEDAPKEHISQLPHDASGNTILIGPEGDFTPEEITLAMDHRFRAVSLGDTRLRTETAAMAVCVMFALSR